MRTAQLRQPINPPVIGSQSLFAVLAEEEDENDNDEESEDESDSAKQEDAAKNGLQISVCGVLRRKVNEKGVHLFWEGLNEVEKNRIFGEV